MLDFLCIGAQRAGTTWLAAQLRENPEVWLHPFKELHYFDCLYYPPSRAFAQDHLQRLALERIEEEFLAERAASRFADIVWLARCADSEWTFTDAWYRYAFSRVPPGLKRGECTPAYACIGPTGIAHVKRLMPDTRIIYIIRDPVERACAQVRMNLARRPDSGGADERVLAEAALREEVLDRSDYARTIADWEVAFAAPGQILYLPYRRIGREPDAVLDEVERHIGVGRGGRQRIVERVSAGARIVLPDRVVDALRTRLAPQTEFLRQRFGEVFVSQI